jgi:GNAT superfamily N-acetyltransferase
MGVTDPSRHLEERHGGYLVSTDPGRFDRAAIHAALTESYWAAGVSRDVVERSLDASLGIGAYHEPDGPAGPAVQVGLLRVVSDRATFAWVCDVYVLAEHRGRGLGKRLMAMALAHPELQGLRRWMLATRDAHRLYAPFGFEPLPEPGRFMIRAAGSARPFRSTSD